MAKERVDVQKILRQYKFDADLLQKIDCSKEDNKRYLQAKKNGEPLPDGIFPSGTDDTFYSVYEPVLSEQEKAEYLQLKQLDYLKSIKNGVTFFVVIASISLFAAFAFLVNVLR